MRIYYIRHGDPNYELDCLTEKGKEQASKTSEFFKDIKIDRIYSSIQTRAKETAQYTADKLNLPILDMEECLTENYVGSFLSVRDENGGFHWMFTVKKYIEEFKRLAYDLNWTKDPFIKDTSIPNGIETIDTAIDNLFLSMGVEHDRKSRRYIISESAPKTIAIFAHGGLAMTFISSILDIPYPQFVTTHDHLATCGIVTIDINEAACKDGARLIRYNEIKY